VSIDIQQVLTQIVGFLLLLALLRRFAWGPLLGVLDERRQKIASDLASIDEGKAEIERMKQAYQAQLADVDSHARLRMQEAAAEGARQARDITDAARQEAQALLEKAGRDVQREVAQARIALRDEIATLAVAAAAQIIRQELDATRNRALVLRYIDEVRGRS